MGGMSLWHWIVVIAVVLLLGGAKKLPGAARSIGQTLRIVKAETKALREDKPPVAHYTITDLDREPGPSAGPKRSDG